MGVLHANTQTARLQHAHTFPRTPVMCAPPTPSCHLLRTAPAQPTDQQPSPDQPAQPGPVQPHDVGADAGRLWANLPMEATGVNSCPSTTVTAAGASLLVRPMHFRPEVRVPRLAAAR